MVSVSGGARLNNLRPDNLPPQGETAISMGYQAGVARRWLDWGPRSFPSFVEINLGPKPRKSKYVPWLFLCALWPPSRLAAAQVNTEQYRTEQSDTASHRVELDFGYKQGNVDLLTADRDIGSTSGNKI